MNKAGFNRGIRLTDTQKISWLQLLRSENVGPATFRDLIMNCGSAQNALEMLPDMVRQGGRRRPISIATKESAVAELEQAQKIGARIIGMGEPDYPYYLLNSPAPPPLITILGNCSIFKHVGVGIVGSRNASVIGARMAQKLAHDLGEMGYAIISGLARGIDTNAHEYSLKTGTVAVLAGGIDHPYPQQNTGLYHQIQREGGAIITEMPLGWAPRAQDFPRRNRIIAGLSTGLIVVEAAHKSGSLITARLAAEMGRIVFAVPGSPMDPRAKGTNSLLKEGATLVTEAEDVSQLLAPLDERVNKQQALFENHNHQPLEDIQFNQGLITQSQDQASKPIKSEHIDDEQIRIVENALSFVPVTMDELLRHTGLQHAKLCMILLRLELAGRLTRHPDGSIGLAAES